MVAIFKDQLIPQIQRMAIFIKSTDSTDTNGGHFFIRSANSTDRNGGHFCKNELIQQIQVVAIFSYDQLIPQIQKVAIFYKISIFASHLADDIGINSLISYI